MFRSLKRCPASLRWRVVRSFSSANPIQSLRHAIVESKGRPSHNLVTIRAIHSSTPRLRDAAVAVQEDDVAHQDQESQPPSSSQIDEATAMGPAKKFIELAERGLVNPGVIDTITKKMGLETMTEVQSLTLNEALKHKDVLAQAKTGTGKTLGFLLPVLQNIIATDPDLAIRSRRARPRGSGSNIRAIIISPTRELAEQIAQEAKKLTQDTSVVVQTAVGGTQKRLHLRLIQQEGCHILVGTPGRINDIFSDSMSGVAAPNLDTLVLDEADRLLDQGFWPEIQAIQDLLPSVRDRDRQTLMYSATVSKDVVKLARTTMKPDLHYVRTVQADEEPTHERVKQMLTVVPSLENQLPAVLELCDREIKAALNAKGRPFKAIVYCNATAETHLASKIFLEHRLSERREPDNLVFGAARIFEIHGRLTQSQRTAAADQFRAAQSGILMSSDVTARGMDFPGVTHIIQVGLPQERDTYIHRLGRTARAGAEGEGWLILPAVALNEARSRLGKLPLQRDTSLESAAVDYSTVLEGQEPEMSPTAKKYFGIVKDSAQRLGQRANFEEAYQAFLGSFQWLKNKGKLIEMMNRVSMVQWGLPQPPSLRSGLVAKLGFRGIPGVRTGASDPRESRESGFGGRGGFSARDRDRAGSGGREGGRGGFGGRDRDSGGFGRPPRRDDSFGGGSFAPPERRGFSERSDNGGGFGDRPERRSGGFDGRPDRSGGRSGGFGGRGGSSYGGDRQRGGYGGSGNGFSRDRGSRGGRSEPATDY